MGQFLENVPQPNLIDSMTLKKHPLVAIRMRLRADQAAVHRGAPQIVCLKSAKVRRRDGCTMQVCVILSPLSSLACFCPPLYLRNSDESDLQNGNNRVHMFALVLADNAPECGAPAVASQSTVLISGVQLEQALLI